MLFKTGDNFKFKRSINTKDLFFGPSKAFSFNAVYFNDFKRPKFQFPIKPVSKAEKLEAGDILFIKSSENKEDVPRFSIYDGPKDMYLNSFCQAIKLDKTMPIYFLTNLFNSQFFKYEFWDFYVNGFTRYNFTAKKLFDKGIEIPDVSLCVKIDAKMKRNFLAMQRLRVEIASFKKIRKDLIDLLFSGMWDASEVMKNFTQFHKTKHIDGDIMTVSKIKGLTRQKDFFAREIANKEKIAKYVNVNPGDWVFNPARINTGSIVVNQNNFNGSVSPLYKTLTISLPEKELKYFFKSKSFKEQVSRLVEGSVRQILSPQKFDEIVYTISDKSIQIMGDIKKAEDLIKNISLLISNIDQASKKECEDFYNEWKRNTK